MTGWRRWLPVAALALAAATGLRAWQSRGHEAEVVYDAPPGDLQVTLLDEEGHTWRRVFFAAGTERRHRAAVPPAGLTARLEVGGREVERPVVAAGEQAVVEVRFSE